MAVAVLLTASCAKEDISSSIVGGGEVEVTFSANLPELGTRANTYGNGANADILYYNVYEADTDNQLGELCGSVESNTGTFTFSLVLLKGMEYDLVFWAQDKDCGYYSLNGKQITVDYTDVDANDDTRDAFFRYVEGFDPTSDTPSFKLYRPFAQLNAAVSAADMTAVGKNEVTLTTSTVTVDTYTGFDISTGDVIGNKSTVTFEATTMPCNLDPKEELKADYTYVSMNYLLVPKIGMVSNVIYTFNATKNGGAFAFTGTSYNDVPLKQNFRTNILGALLTAPTQFTVEIEEEFNQPDQIPVNVADAQELQQALADPDINSIVLSDDIDLNDLFNSSTLSTRATAGTYGLLIPAGKEFTIDLNGKTLTHSKEQTGAYAMIVNDGKLTIEDTSANADGMIIYADTGKGANYGSNTILNNGTLIVNSGILVNNSSADVATNGYPHVIDNNANLTINGGTLTNNTNYSSVRIWCTTDDNTEVTINGGTFNGCIDFHNVNTNANKGTLTINGGTFNADNYTKCATRLLGFGLDVDEFTANIYGGTFNGDIKLRNYVGSGEFNSNVYTVYGGTFANLANVLPFLADGANISISEPLTVAADEELTLDLTGKSVTYTSEVMNESMIDNKGTLTIKGGKFTYVYAGAPDTSYGKGNYAVNNTNKLTIDGGSIEVVMLQNPKHALYALNDNAINSNTSLTINGGEIINNYGHAFRAITNKQSDITINGGEIIGKTRAIWLQLPGSNNAVAPTINLTINGGTLTGSEFDSSDNKLAIYSYSYGNDMKNVKIDITGGTFNGDIALTGGANKTNIETITVSGGTFNGCYGDVYSYGEADKAKKAISISGGTFSALDVVNYATADADIDIVLGNDVVTTSTATVAAGSKVALDLNGHNVSYAVENSGATAIINNKGELNISNSGAEATISFVAANPDLGSIPAYATNTITNTGILTIGENVVVTNGSDGGASYAVDNHSVFTLNGGKLVGNRCALRVAKYNNPDVVFTMESGLIEAMTPAWIQLPGSNSAVAPNISVVINDGILRSTKESSADNNAMYTYSYGNSHANTNITINGGQFLGGTVSIGSGYKGDAPTLTINGGVFEYDVLQWLENDQYDVIYKANK